MSDAVNSKLPGVVRVLLIEDDKVWADEVRSAVEDLGGECILCDNLDDGVALAIQDEPPYHVIILDRTFDGDDRDGLSFFDMIADFSKPKIPVIVLSIKKTPEQRAEAYAAGGLTFLQKPFYRVELQAVLRSQVAFNNCIRGDLELDLKERISRWQGKEFPLPPRLFKLLHLLCETPGKTVPRSITGRVVFGENYTDRDIDGAVSQLRSILLEITGDKIVKVVPRVGHKIDPASLNIKDT